MEIEPRHSDVEHMHTSDIMTARLTTSPAILCFDRNISKNSEVIIVDGDRAYF